MVRKASDMVLLLGSRGQYRGRNSSGFVGALRRFGASALHFVGFTRPTNVRRGETRASRVSKQSGWIALGGALVCFAIGYLVGHSTSGPLTGPGTTGLKADGGGANGPTPPAMIGEFDTRPMTSQAFVVSAYPGLPVDEAKARAKALCIWLHGQQILRARPYEYSAEKGTIWVVAVYYDGPAEETATRARLQALPEDVPDETLVWNRKNKPEGWPPARQIR